MNMRKTEPTKRICRYIVRIIILHTILNTYVANAEPTGKMNPEKVDVVIGGIANVAFPSGYDQGFIVTNCTALLLPDTSNPNQLKGLSSGTGAVPSCSAVEGLWTDENGDVRRKVVGTVVVWHEALPSNFKQTLSLSPDKSNYFDGESVAHTGSGSVTVMNCGAKTRRLRIRIVQMKCCGDVIEGSFREESQDILANERITLRVNSLPRSAQMKYVLEPCSTCEVDWVLEDNVGVAIDCPISRGEKKVEYCVVPQGGNGQQ